MKKRLGYNNISEFFGNLVIFIAFVGFCNLIPILGLASLREAAEGTFVETIFKGLNIILHIYSIGVVILLVLTYIYSIHQKNMLVGRLIEETEGLCELFLICSILVSVVSLILMFVVYFLSQINVLVVVLGLVSSICLYSGLIGICMALIIGLYSIFIEDDGNGSDFYY